MPSNGRWDLIRRLKVKKGMGRVCVNDGGEPSVYSVLVGNLGGKGPLARLRNRWENNHNMDLKWVGVDWICVAQDRDKRRGLTGTGMNPRFP
jgi:hypothetical protein